MTCFWCKTAAGEAAPPLLDKIGSKEEEIQLTVKNLHPEYQASGRWLPLSISNTSIAAPYYCIQLQGSIATSSRLPPDGRPDRMAGSTGYDMSAVPQSTAAIQTSQGWTPISCRLP